MWPKTREQRDRFHKLGNILDKLPQRLQPRVKAALHEVRYAETRAQAREAVKRFATDYGPKHPKAVTTLEKDADVLLTSSTAHVQRDRVAIRDRAAAPARDEGRRLADVQQEGKASRTRARSA